VKRDVELAAVEITFEVDGRRYPMPWFTFVKTGSSWKFTTKDT
jgi:hypothetical protein